MKGRVGPLALSEIPAMTVMALRGRVKRCLEERRQVIDALFAEKNKCGVDTAFERPADALQPGDRAVVFYGQGHVPQLAACLRSAPGVELIEAGAFLPSP